MHNCLFILSSEESLQGDRGLRNRWSLHLRVQNSSFVLVLYENKASIVSKVLARHLHRWLIRVIELGLQLTPLLNQRSQSSDLVPDNLWTIMAKSKGIRIVVTLECTECRTATAAEKRSPGVSRYTTTKNRRNNPDRLELMKFCPQLNKMTLHREIK